MSVWDGRTGHRFGQGAGCSLETDISTQKYCCLHDTNPVMTMTPLPRWARGTNHALTPTHNRLLHRTLLLLVVSLNRRRVPPGQPPLQRKQRVIGGLRVVAKVTRRQRRDGCPLVTNLVIDVFLKRSVLRHLLAAVFRRPELELLELLLAYIFSHLLLRQPGHRAKQHILILFHRRLHPRIHLCFRSSLRFLLHGLLLLRRLCHVPNLRGSPRRCHSLPRHRIAPRRGGSELRHAPRRDPA
mmetsp:Transcript_7347/g.29783  ORF Transcript_7347/g.29783 Transcript_7347/m.29783 type:complete len:241 (-) Transcript_7347:4417-5139(-)